MDQMSFKRAGRAPPVKTYKYNPKDEALAAKSNS